MIVITTPSGLIGHQVRDNLLDSGEELRAIARDPSALPADVRERLDVVEGSHGDPAVVDEAFADADAVFWLTPPDPQAPSVEAAFVGFTRPAAEAFTRHGVERVVGVSALGRGRPWADRAGYVTGSLAMDDLIASSGVGYRALTNPSFMDNVVRQAGTIKNQGMLFSPIDRDRKLPSVATRDTAAAASRLLLDESWSGVDEVPLLGHLRGARQGGSLPADHLQGVRGHVRPLRDVRCDGEGHDRHGLGEERGPRQRRSADVGELDADELPPMVRRGAQAGPPRSDKGGSVLRRISCNRSKGRRHA
jgi:uncharacterized protein YbjT (DUF2867 family)